MENAKEEKNIYTYEEYSLTSIIIFILIIIIIIVFAAVSFYFTFLRYNLAYEAIKKGDTTSTTLLLTPEITEGISKIITSFKNNKN